MAGTKGAGRAGKGAPPQSSTAADEVRRRVLPGLVDVPDDAVHLTGFLGKRGSQHVLYPFIEDRTSYAEFDPEDTLACVPHAPTDRVTLSLKPTAKLRWVRTDGGAGARFLTGNLARANMVRAIDAGAELPDGHHLPSVIKTWPCCYGTTCTGSYFTHG